MLYSTGSEYLDLWSNDPAIRLNAARRLDSAAIERLTSSLLDKCPLTSWPFGSPTVANPFLLTLAVSPGGSPSNENLEEHIIEAYAGPTFGRPHDGIYYPDRARFWRKLRNLAEICFPNFNETDAHSLYGHLNLDNGCAGNARYASFNPKLGRWVLDRIVNHLRPRFVIILGVQGYLKHFPEARNAVNEILFNGVEIAGVRCLTEPHRAIPLNSYSKANLCFREWDVQYSDGRMITYVFWPQHPSRPPFSSFDYWVEACEDFFERHKKVLTSVC